MSYLAHGSQFLECWSQTARNVIVWNVQKNKYRYFFCLGVTSQVDRPTTSSVLWVHSGCDCHSFETDFLAHPERMRVIQLVPGRAQSRESSTILSMTKSQQSHGVIELLFGGKSCQVVVFFFCTVLQFLVINVLNPVIFTNLSKCLFLKCANSRSKLVYKTEQLALLGSLWYGLYSKIQSIEKCHTFLKLYSQQRNAQCKEKVFLCDAMPWLIGGPLCWAQQACSCAWVQVHAQVCCWLRSHHLAGQSPEEGYRRVNCLGNFSGICIINANEVLACRCSQLCKQKWWNMTSFWTNLWFYTGCH